MDCSSQGPCEPVGSPAKPALSEEQKSLVFRAAGRRVTAAVLGRRGESTRAMLGAAADTPVYGAFVTLKRAGRLRSCCGCIENSMPLGDALDRAADRAATDDPRFAPISPDELSELDMDVWILWGPELVAARGEDRVQAVTIGKHGVQIACRGARGLLLPGVAVEHRFDARTFLQQVCIKAGLPTDAWKDDRAQLWVFEGDAIHGRFPIEQSDARPPAVAGGFYPGNPSEVQRMVEKLFAGTEGVIAEAWSGVMVPHAGWVYSGRLAAATFRRVQIPETAIIFCPRHRPHGAIWAAAPHDRWLFPGGELAGEIELARRLAEAVPGLKLDAAAHREEHAIEVQLPLLAHLAPQVRIVGIAVGDGSLTELLQFGDHLAGVIRDMTQRPLLVISSDLNHFADDAETRRVDHLVLDAIDTLDPAQVYKTVRENRISMCGLGPCVIVMQALRQLGCLKRCERVGYSTSGEVNGATNRVVGYGGLLFG